MTDAAPTLDPYALYRYFDTQDILLYVGISGDLAVRDASHISRSRWMQLTARSTVERHKTLEDIKKAEREAIETEHPLFNVQYNDTPEAKKRLRTYLEGIGRLDLLYPKQDPNAGTHPALKVERQPQPAAPAQSDPIDEQRPEEYADEGHAYRARWERWAARAWWRPLWEYHGEVLEDMANLIAPSRGITEAIGELLSAHREGQTWPMTWVTMTQVPGDPGEGDTYPWSAHIDFSFSEEKPPPGTSPEELAIRRSFADALIEAGRCSSARVSAQVVISGFRNQLDAKFAAMAIRGDDETVLRCTARLRGGLDPNEIREARIGALLAQLGEHSDRDVLLSTLEELLRNRKPDDKNRRPAA